MNKSNIMLCCCLYIVRYIRATGNGLNSFTLYSISYKSLLVKLVKNCNTKKRLGRQQHSIIIGTYVSYYNNKRYTVG